VRQFWEQNPLWSGETRHEVGSCPYFEEHRRVVIGDCLAGRMDESIFPKGENRTRVLDLGCGPGFWTVELAGRGCRQIVAADLTQTALNLAKRRCEVYGVEAEFCIQNAEKLTFPDGSFAHVNCQGVIHHTPDTAACVQEIARVLRPGGTACISVYFRNILLRMWPGLWWMGRILAKAGAGMKGRGRERIFASRDANEIVRLYDGHHNPLGKCYSKREFLSMLAPHFRVDRVFYHFFPARAIPVRVPAFLHRLCDRALPFMIYVFVTKP
jgi:SAM-dependent methyltransferase